MEGCCEIIGIALFPTYLIVIYYVWFIALLKPLPCRQYLAAEEQLFHDINCLINLAATTQVHKSLQLLTQLNKCLIAIV